MKVKLFVSVLLSGFLISACAPGDMVNILINGDFETGDFTGWTTNSSTIEHLFSITNGTTNAIGHVTPGNYNGSWHADFLQDDQGSSVLYQSFTLPDILNTAILTVYMYTFSHVTVEITNSLTNGGQFISIDILNEGADPMSIDDSDVAYTLIRGGDTNTNLVYTLYEADLSEILQPGQTYILRFGGAIYNNSFDVSLDDISLEVN